MGTQGFGVRDTYSLNGISLIQPQGKANGVCWSLLLWTASEKKENSPNSVWDSEHKYRQKSCIKYFTFEIFDVYQ